MPPNEKRRNGLVRKLFAAFTWFGLHEFPVLLSVVALSCGIWAFVELADEVLEQETAPIDKTLLLSLRDPGDHADLIGPPWLEEMGRDFTALGSTGVLMVLILAALGYLLLAGRSRTALLTAIAVSGGTLLGTLLKIGFARPRPDLVPADAIAYTSSFPSGHSMMAAVTYLTLAAMLARVHSQPLLKAYLLIVAILLTLLVGVSRVYLGMHWPTDVLAGWTAGAAWAALCWLAARWLQRRDLVEGER